MHYSIFTSLLLAAGASARSSRHVRLPNRDAPPDASLSKPRYLARQTGPPSYSPPNGTIIPQTPKTDKFKVDGTALPDIHFDIGESYAGLLPISNAPNASELYFWFFPTANPAAKDEIVIWLNGGPGCSSLEGWLQENGPALWQYGTFLPVQNQYTWINLTNMIWVEQPAGTGFSSFGSTPRATSEEEVAAQFLGFFKNFIDTFELYGRKIYITGESYAGRYVPFIADAMHNASDPKYYGIESIMFFDGSLTSNVVQRDIPAVPYVDTWSGLFNLNQTFVNYLHEQADKCGYTDFYKQAMQFPPKGPLPTPPNIDGSVEGCSLWSDIDSAVMLTNPCFDRYQIATTCPLLWDVLGFPGSFDYLPEGAEIYFNRAEVQKAINAPIQPWAECSDGVLDQDTSVDSVDILPRVIAKNKQTIIGHADLDWILIDAGTVMAIQNMTWNGAQGFSKGPNEWQDLFVPYHTERNVNNAAGAGNLGRWHEERGLTYVSVALSGHMVPQYAPSTAYRMLEVMLGRVKDLSSADKFTTQ